MNKKQLYLSVSDFFKDDNFIAWRLFRTQELDQLWAGFIKENPQTTPLLQKACQQFDAVKLNETTLPSEAEKDLYQNIRKRIRAYKRNKRKTATYWLAAACLALIVASATYLTLLNKPEDAITRSEIVGKSLPEKNIQLIAEDQITTLESDAVITLLADNQAVITYSTNNVRKIKLNKNNKLIVPYGKQTSIKLADGTQVWLNSGTELDFPTSFTGNSRNIRIKGEAYLEVAKSDRPLMVHTQDATVRVLGTKFNISAYENDTKATVILLEGSVQLESAKGKHIKLLPNEMATVSTSGAIEKKTVKAADDETSWIYGYMSFEQTPMTEVLKQIERYYNLSFNYEHDISLQTRTCSGKIFLSKNIDNIMETIALLTSTQYKKEDNKIYINHKD